jgi:hypothetical protein
VVNVVNVVNVVTLSIRAKGAKCLDLRTIQMVPADFKRHAGLVCQVVRPRRAQPPGTLFNGQPPRAGTSIVDALLEGRREGR